MRDGAQELCCVRREQRRAGQGSPRCTVLLSGAYRTLLHLPALVLLSRSLHSMRRGNGDEEGYAEVDVVDLQTNKISGTGCL
jgi:hypothetical protein